MVVLMSSFIMRKPSPKSPFTNAAITTVGKTETPGCVPLLNVGGC
jgi:hypothetical protein